MDWRAGKAVPLHPGPLSGGFAVLYSFLVTGNTLPLLCGMWRVACGSIVATQVQSSTRSPAWVGCYLLARVAFPCKLLLWLCMLSGYGL